jgi:hypothetical protein
MSSRVLEIVPPKSLPARTPRHQRHSPQRTDDYRDYRACLRWDAGFTCCFCLVHESDLMRTGSAEGTGLMSIEHLEPQARAPHLVNVYANCAYACRFCNNVRRTQPSQHSSGARLLHPWSDAWGAHFRLRDDRLEPLHEGDAGRDARYTMDVYRLNDDRKVEMRRLRRTQLEAYLELFEHDLVELRRIAEQQTSVEERRKHAARIGTLAKCRKLANDELSRRTAIPADAPGRCRCDSREHHCLPPETEVLRVSLA